MGLKMVVFKRVWKCMYVCLSGVICSWPDITHEVGIIRFNTVGNRIFNNIYPNNNVIDL